MKAEDVKKEKVADIFRSMDEGKETVNVDFAQEFVNKINSGETNSLNVEELNSIHGDAILQCLDKLNERRNDVVSLLVLQKYTWNNANLIFDSLINSIKAYYVRHEITPCSFIGLDRCVSTRSSNLLLDIKYLVKQLFVTHRFRILCDAPDELEQLFKLLQQICESSLIYPEFYRYHGIKDTPDDSDQLWKEDLFFENGSCPIIITGDADIDAAVDNVCKSICQSEAVTVSGVSHVLIEESVYAQTALLLEDKIKRIKHGSRFDKRTELQLSDASSNVETTSHRNLRVWSPCEGSPIKLCMGWNPKDIDQTDAYSKRNGYITVIPYRNLAELKTLIQDNFERVCPASIWSESINATKAESDFQFSPLWINCHGLFHPAYPHYTDSYPEDVLYGKIFSSSIDAFKIHPVVTSADSEILKCLDSARKAYWELQKEELSVFVTLRDLLKKKKIESDNCSSCSDCQLINLDVDKKIKSVLDYMIGGQISKTQMKCLRKPVGIIWISCDLTGYPSSSFFGCLKRLVAASLINGSPVVVASQSSEIIDDCMQNLDDFKALPKGFFNFCCTNLERKCLFTGKNNKPRVKVINLNSHLNFQWSSNCLVDYSKTTICPRKLLSLTTALTCVWTS